MELPRPLEQLEHEEPGAVLALAVDHLVERVEPFLGLGRVDVGQLVLEFVEVHLALRANGTTGGYPHPAGIRADRLPQGARVQFVDLTSALGGGLVGGSIAAIIAGIVTLKVQARQHTFDASQADAARRHELGVARDARLQERKADTHRDMIEMAYRVQDIVNQTFPFFESVPPPPRVESPSMDDQRAMAARISAFGSPDIVDRFQEGRGQV